MSANPTAHPATLVVGARSHKKSMDPVDLLTDATRVDHFRRGDRIETTIGEPGEAYECTIDLTETSPARTATEFVTANDYIYWTNGVCDRTFYDAGLADADMDAVPPSGYELTDQTEWAPFVDPEPVAVLVYNRAIEFAMSPWVNLDHMED